MLRRGVALLLFFLFLAEWPTCQAANKENSGEAEIFCQIRLLAENDPEKLVFENEEREKKILRRIEEVGPEIRSLSGQADTREVSLVAQFHEIVKELRKLMVNMGDLRRKAAEKRLSAKRHLHQVIFGDYGGEGKGELDAKPETINKIFSSKKFENSCGGKEDKPAGKSLINDFICLCAHSFKQTNEDQSICKYNVDTTVDSDFKNWTKVWHENNHRICVNTPPLTPTPQNIDKLVALFERAVERNQTGSQVKNVFGYVKKDNSEKICNGTNAGFTCVNYIHTLSHGGIEWVNHLKNASQELKDMRRFAEESESTLPELELLEYNALLLFEEAKYSAHLPHAAPSNETDTNSSNESYEEDPHDKSNETNKVADANNSQEGDLEEIELEEDGKNEATWRGGLPRWGFVCFLMFF